jgi:hypothetical protein
LVIGSKKRRSTIMLSWNSTISYLSAKITQSNESELVSRSSRKVLFISQYTKNCQVSVESSGNLSLPDCPSAKVSPLTKAAKTGETLAKCRSCM